MAVNVKSMNAKKTPKVATATSTKQVKKAESFFSDVKAEFKKITWTGKEELQTYTKIVVAATFLFGMGIYFIDLAIRAALSTLEGVALWVFG